MSLTPIDFIIISMSLVIKMLYIHNLYQSIEVKQLLEVNNYINNHGRVAKTNMQLISEFWI